MSGILKKGLCIAMISLICTVMTTGCSGAAKEKFTTAQKNVTQKVKEEAKEAIITQIEDFFEDTDFMESYGITDEQKEKIESELEAIVNDYEFDIESMKDLQEQLDSIFDEDTIEQEQSQDNEEVKEALEKLKKQIENNLFK